MVNCLSLPQVNGRNPNTFVTFGWEDPGDASANPKCSVVGVSSVILRSTNPSWEHEATVDLPRIAVGAQLEPYSHEQLEFLHLCIQVWHLEDHHQCRHRRQPSCRCSIR